MNDTDLYFKISDIEKLYNIGPDSLYYYEKKGLLNPQRDSDNNYRIYSMVEIQQMNMIRELLSLNFSTEQIKYFMQNKNTHNTIKLLNKELNIVNESIIKLFLKKSSIEARLASFNKAINASKDERIKVLEIDERRCIMISDTSIPQNELDYAIIRYMKTHAQGIDTIGSCDCYTLSLDDNPESSDFYKIKNIFFYSEQHNYQSNYVLPAGKYLSLTYCGSSTRTKQLMPRLFDYAKENKYDIISDPMEFCWIDEYETTNNEEHITELQVQIK